MSNEILNNAEVVETVEVKEEKEYWQIAKPKFLSKKSKEVKEAIKENEEPKKGSKVKKFLKGAALVGLGALAGVAGKTIVDKAGSDDYVIEDEGVEIVDDTDETA